MGRTLLVSGAVMLSFQGYSYQGNKEHVNRVYLALSPSGWEGRGDEALLPPMRGVYDSMHALHSSSCSANPV